MEGKDAVGRPPMDRLPITNEEDKWRGNRKIGKERNGELLQPPLTAAD